MDVIEEDVATSWERCYNVNNFNFTEASSNINPLSVHSDSETDDYQNYKLKLKSQLSNLNPIESHENDFINSSNSMQQKFQLKILKVDLMKLPDIKPIINKPNVKRIDKKKSRRLKPRKSHHVRKLSLECPNKCGKVFNYNRTLCKHLETVCGLKSRYKCPYCEHYNKHRYLVVRHVRIHHPYLKETVIDQCNPNINETIGNDLEPVKMENFDDEDTKEKLTKANLLESIKYWNADSEIKISNVSSLASLEDIKPEIKELVLVKNPLQRKKKLPCPNNCGRIFKYFNRLNSHVKFECEQIPRFKCPYCQVHSKFSRNILSHVKLLHHDREIYAIDTVTNKLFGNNLRQSERLSNAAKSTLTPII